jgi:hypothetical protein
MTDRREQCAIADEDLIGPGLDLDFNETVPRLARPLRKAVIAGVEVAANASGAVARAIWRCGASPKAAASGAGAAAWRFKSLLRRRFAG